MEKHISALFSQATHTAKSNLALCLALLLSSTTLLTATIFYLDQAETKCWRKNQHTGIREQVFTKHGKWTKRDSQSDLLIDKETE